MPDLPDKLPKHVAVIMDGNGRWAKSRGLPRLKGHEEGAESARAVIRACKEAGIQYLTLYAFSLENWVRPKAEVAGLMKLLMFNLKTYSHELHDNQIRLKVIGRTELLPVPIRMALNQAIKETESYSEGTLILALSYGSRPELVDAARALAQQVKDGELSVEEIDEEAFADNLYTAGIPDPDLMIRTSGEQRISNYLLWQLSYSELYFTDVYWPDFREEQFYEALREYAKRKRRFGDITEKEEGRS
jgi:undecaprenyl diphosphate synthase